MTTHSSASATTAPAARAACARRWRRSQPDVVLVEGPPDAEEVLPLLAHEEMEPPVALLVYAPDAPEHRRSSIRSPRFSPEWQAIRYALGRKRARAVHGPAAGDQLAR